MRAFLKCRLVSLSGAGTRVIHAHLGRDGKEILEIADGYNSYPVFESVSRLCGCPGPVISRLAPWTFGPITTFTAVSDSGHLGGHESGYPGQAFDLQGALLRVGGHFDTFSYGVQTRRTMKTNKLFLMVFLLVGCQAEAPESGRGSAGKPGAASSGSPGPGNVAPRAQPPSPPLARPEVASCHDPVLERAFEALSSCDYKAGVIDFQCPAWKALQTVLAERELENQALVQLTLLRLLDHAEERVRLAVAKSLSAYSRQRSVVRRLGEVFRKEQSPEVRAWIVFSLHSSSPEAKALVLGALKGDASALVRAKAAQRLNLAHFGRDKDVREALLEALRQDRAEEVRKRSAESLGQASGDVEAEKVLLGCLSDPALGPHCGMGLARLGTPGGYGAILDLVKKGTADRTVHPLHLLNLADFVRRPFFSAAVVRPLFLAVARDQRMALGARHYATRALGRLGRDLMSERAAVLGALRALAQDKILGSYARSELEQLEQPGPAASGNR